MYLRPTRTCKQLRILLDQDGLLYRLDKLCLPKGGNLPLIREAHTSKVVGNFGAGNIVANLQMYGYCPKM